MHDSWSYFAEAFGLQIVAAAEPHPGVPPSPAELAALFQRMREAGVRDPRSPTRIRIPSLVRQIVEQDRRAGRDAAPLRPRLLRLFDENVSSSPPR